MQKKGAAGKDNRILIIGLLVIFIIAFVVMNFGKFTGNATKEKATTTVEIENSEISPGEYVIINMVPGKAGAYEKYYVCTSYNDVCIARPRFECNQFKCLKPVTAKYKSWGGWESGIYYVKVFDYGAKEYVKAYFTVE